MLYDFEDLTFGILAVERLRHPDGTHRIEGRPFAALAFRLSGEVEFEIAGKRFSSRAGDVCFIPQNVSYTAVYSACEYVVVHFKKCNYKTCENFSVDNISYTTAEFSKLHTEWKEKHSALRAKATLYKILSRTAEDKALTINDTAFLKSLRYMEENLSDPTLSLLRVCAAAGISGGAYPAYPPPRSPNPRCGAAPSRSGRFPPGAHCRLRDSPRREPRYR